MIIIILRKPKNCGSTSKSWIDKLVVRPYFHAFFVAGFTKEFHGQFRLRKCYIKRIEVIKWGNANVIERDKGTWTALHFPFFLMWILGLMRTIGLNGWDRTWIIMYFFPSFFIRTIDRWRFAALSVISWKIILRLYIFSWIWFGWYQGFFDSTEDVIPTWPGNGY